MWIWIWEMAWLQIRIQIHLKKVRSRNADYCGKPPLWTSFVKKVGSKEWRGSRTRSRSTPKNSDPETLIFEVKPPPWTSFFKKVAMSKTFATCQRALMETLNEDHLLEQALSRRSPCQGASARTFLTWWASLQTLWLMSYSKKWKR